MQLNIFSDENTQYYVQSKIEETVPEIRKTGGKWNFRCPVCGDSRRRVNVKRGYYYPDTNSYHCFHENGCGASGLWIVAKFTSVPYDQVKKDFIAFQRKMGSDKFGLKSTRMPVKTVDRVQDRPVEGIPIPDCWMPVNERETPDAYRYLARRRIFEAPFLPKGYEFYFNADTRRLVLPWRMDGEMIYYQQRALYKGQEPKYLFPRTEKAVKTIFGLDSIDICFPYIFLLEGVLDCIYVKNGVAIGGLDYTEYQGTLLEGYPMCEPVYMLDNQRTDPSSKRKLESLVERDHKIKIFVWPKDILAKDVNEHVCRTGANPFSDGEFMKKRVFSGLKGLLEVRGSL